MVKFQKVPKLMNFQGKIRLMSEVEFRVNKRKCLSSFNWYGWYKKLFYDPVADEFIIDGEHVSLDYAYEYASKTNMEAR
ncbi:MAG: hypothetical protein LBF36_00010 [Mycoplasmataceae bacterium]|jgi:hypothetical protein|nr:hypothetical protein [Mycoplasmataceae bacterium]